MARENFSYESARLRALSDLSKAIVVPTVILASFVWTTEVRLGYYTVPCHCLCIFLGSYLQGLYRSFRLERDARRLGGPVESVPV